MKATDLVVLPPRSGARTSTDHQDGLASIPYGIRTSTTTTTTTTTTTSLTTSTKSSSTTTTTSTHTGAPSDPATGSFANCTIYHNVVSGGQHKVEHRCGHHLHHVHRLLRLPLAAHLECSPCVRIEPVQNETVKLTPDLTTRTRPHARRTSTAARTSRSSAPRTPRCSHACYSPRVWARKATCFRVRSHQRARTYCKSAISGRTWRSRMASRAPSSPRSHAQTSAGCSHGLAGMYEAPTTADFSQSVHRQRADMRADMPIVQRLCG
jgi:hypothetical protein